MFHTVCWPQNTSIGRNNTRSINSSRRGGLNNFSSNQDRGRSRGNSISDSRSSRGRDHDRGRRRSRSRRRDSGSASGSNDDRDRGGNRSRSRDRGRRSTESGSSLTSAGQEKTIGSDGPQRARPQGKSTVVKRQGGGKGGGKSGRSTKTVSLPDIKIHQSVKSSAIYFEPSNYTQQVGDSFQTSLMGYRPGDERSDLFDLWIRYDSRLLAPVWVDLSPIEEKLYPGYGVKVWREDGYIQLSGKVRDPIDPEAIYQLAHFHWKTLKPAFETSIEFSTEGDRQSVIQVAGRNILEPTGLGNEQKISARVRITPGVSPGDEIGLVTAEQIRSRYFGEVEDEGERIRLTIVSPGRFVESGGVSHADIVLLNPAEMAFDELKFRIRYNADSIKILDADENNYITTGINLFDGDFHLDFPFDVHRINRVDPDRGYLDYRVGSTRGPRAYQSGTVARIVFRMKRQSGQASFWFERMDPIHGEITTDVVAEGRSLLGKKNDTAGQVLHGMKIEVRPLDLGG
jgi:hypothetical protein